MSPCFVFEFWERERERRKHVCLFVSTVRILHCFCRSNVSSRRFPPSFFSKTKQEDLQVKIRVAFWDSLLPSESWPLQFQTRELQNLPPKVPHQPSFLAQRWPYLCLHRKWRRHRLVCFQHWFHVRYCTQVQGSSCLHWGTHNLISCLKNETQNIYNSVFFSVGCITFAAPVLWRVNAIW